MITTVLTIAAADTAAAIIHQGKVFSSFSMSCGVLSGLGSFVSWSTEFESVSAGVRFVSAESLLLWADSFEESTGSVIDTEGSFPEPDVSAAVFLSVSIGLVSVG